MFQQPSQGDRLAMADVFGSLVLIWVREYREDIQTAYGEKDAIACDVHVLDGAKGGEKFEHTLIFGGALIGSLRSAAGGDPVLGRISQGVSKPGQNAPWIIQPFTAEDAALATSYIQRMPKPFQAPASGNGNGNGQPPNPPAAAAPSAAAATPSPATTAATPASSASASPPVDYSALPPEVLELLRQSGQLPAGV
jgi:hypothetical protein